MHILHVISSLQRSGGGPSRSAQGLVSALNAAGLDTWLMTLKKGEVPWVDGVSRFINGNPFENAVLQINPDIVHLHGIWSLELHRCAVICRRFHIPYVIAPRGMLEPWSLQQKWLKKRIARLLYQDWDLKYAAALHATAESEAEQFRLLEFKNPVIISPNGVNVPKNFNRVECKSERRALFVSRMHPKKGVLELVEAWKNAKMDGWKCELVYTVSGDFEMEYELKVKARVHELGLDNVFIFTGSLDDNAKWNAYARADLFVLPTYSENFGIVVAEALWAGVPVITTKGAPWSELMTEKCGWWIDLPAEGSISSGWKSLSAALSTAKGLSETERVDMGRRGKRLVELKYTWDAVCGAMVKGYESILK